MKNEKNKAKQKKTTNPVDIIDLTAIMENTAFDSDPMGSYTGTPVDGGRPVQDADDL